MNGMSLASNSLPAGWLAELLGSWVVCITWPRCCKWRWKAEMKHV